MKSQKKIKETEVLERFATSEMTKEQREKNLEAYGLFRQKAESKRSTEDKLKVELLQLKYLMEDYLEANNFKQLYNFSYFLQQYIDKLNKKNKEFANEIDVAPSLLSQILNNRRKPNEEFIIRLELHSNRNFPAIMWYRILEREREQELINNTELRKAQNKHVKRKLEFSI